MIRLTIPSFLADLKLEVEKAGATPRLRGSSIMFGDKPHMCALDFYLKAKGILHPTSYTSDMKVLGMDESDAWAVMSANDNATYKAQRVDQELRAVLLALVPNATV